MNDTATAATPLYAEPVDGRQIELVRPGQIEIIRTLDPERQRQRLDWYMSQVDSILEAGDLMIPFGYPKEENARRAAVKLALMYGAELGIPPISAIRSCFFVNNRIALHSDGPPAVAFASGLLRDKGEWIVNYKVLGIIAGGGELLGNFPPDFRAALQLEAMDALSLAHDDPHWMCAVALAWRRGMSMPVVRAFSMTDANQAGLLSKKGELWAKHTKRMLLARARTFACRDAVPEAYQGIPTVEEAQEIEAARAVGQPVIVEGVRTVESIHAEATLTADMRGREDMEGMRARAVSILRTRFGVEPKLSAAAWRVTKETLLGGAEPATAEQWERAAAFLEKLGPNEKRVRQYMQGEPEAEQTQAPPAEPVSPPAQPSEPSSPEPAPEPAAT